MKTYVIMEGGGVKGCALAGALAAAENIGIQPVGYGGSSAGALVATLGAAHYTGREIGDKLIDMDLARLLDGKGETLKKFTETFRQYEGADDLPISRLKLVGLSFMVQPILKKYWTSLGMYDGEALIIEIEALIQQKIPAFTRKTTFQEFADMEACPLRIVASNVTRKEPIVFCAEKTPNHSVLDAVRSSASYPLVFRPFASHTEQHHLVDGGLSSNLPSFLFTDEYSRCGVPSILFDLYQLGSKPKMASNIIYYFKDLFATALESSDHILRWIGRGTIPVAVEVPADINTLDFFIDRKDRDRLFDKGYQSTAKNLNALPRIQTLRNAGSEQHRQLIAMYGIPALYQPILKAITDTVGAKSSAKNVRASIFLPTDRNSLMNVYNVGFSNASDKTLELPRGEGAAWDAWLHSERAVLCDLEDNEYQYKLKGANAHLVEKDRKALICMNIPSVVSAEGATSPLAILSIDTSTELQSTRWMDDNGREIHGILTTWIPIIQRVIKANLS